MLVFFEKSQLFW